MDKKGSNIIQKQVVSFRIPTAIWQKAVNKSHYYGDSVNKLIIKFLVDYVEDWEMKE